MKVSSVRNCDCRDSGGVSHRTTGLPVGIYKKEADHGNGFLRRDKLYRNNVGENGFSLIALTCSDAATERDQYRSLGYDCGPVISFRRDVKQPDGSEKQIAVNLFITSSEKSPDLALFSCQWVSEKMFDDAHKVHANGAIGISSIAIASDGADETSRYLTNIAGEFNTDSHEIGLQNCNLVQLTAEELKQDYDIEHNDAQPGLRAVAMDIIVSDIYYTAVVLRISGIASKQIGNRLVVAPAAGQGYTIAFIEQENTQ